MANQCAVIKGATSADNKSGDGTRATLLHVSEPRPPSGAGLSGRVYFHEADISSAATMDPFTHVYMFDIGFPPKARQRRVCAGQGVCVREHDGAHLSDAALSRNSKEIQQ